jgi:hypothetical protein
VPQVQLIFDPALEVDARAVAALWAADPEAAAVMSGRPEVRREKPATYLPEVMELVVIPLAVNVASTVLIDIATRLFRKYRPEGGADVKEVEFARQDGDRTLATAPADDADPPA